MRRDDSGYIMILALIIIVSLSAISLSIMSVVATKYPWSHRNNTLSNAIYAAEAGISDTIQQLGGNSNFAGYTTTPRQFYDRGQNGSSTYNTTVTTNADGGRTITSTGTVYDFPGDPSPISKRIVAVVKPALSTLQYSGIAGPGGMIVDGSRVVGVTNLAVMGQLTVDGSSSAFGTADTSNDTPSNPAITTYIANFGCGSGSTYPSACGSGTYAANLTGGGHIFGNVCATGNIFVDSNPKSGVFPGNGTGLIAGCIAPVMAPPVIDKAALVATMTTTLPSTLGQCSGGGGSATWNANTKYTGDITASNCVITLKGNTYITGDLTTKNGAMVLQVDDSAGTITPTILVNGVVSIDQTNIQRNSFGTGAKIISFASSNPACSNSDSCNSLSGSDLATSVTMTTATATRNSNLTGATLWAYYGGLVISQSSISGAIGQRITLTGSSTMSPSSNGTSVGMSTIIWKITDYQQQYP